MVMFACGHVGGEFEDLNGSLWLEFEIVMFVE